MMSISKYRLRFKYKATLVAVFFFIFFGTNALFSNPNIGDLRKTVRERASLVTKLRVLNRVSKHRSTMTKWNLQDAVVFLFGENPQVEEHGNGKMLYSMPGSRYVILDDPLGHYFRIYDQSIGDEKFSYVDREFNNFGFAQGKLRISLVEFNERTHFTYNAPLGEKTIELEQDKLMNEISFFGGSDWQKLGSFVTETDQKRRTAILKKIDWDDLSYQEQRYIIEFSQDTTSSFEVEEFIRLGASSNDLTWLPILKNWSREWDSLKVGWQTYLQDSLKNKIANLNYIKTLLFQKYYGDFMINGITLPSEHKISLLIAEKHEEKLIELITKFSQAYPDSGLLSRSHAEIWNAILKQVEIVGWRQMPNDEKEMILEISRWTTDLNEAGKIISLARKTNDSRWLPVLEQIRLNLNIDSPVFKVKNVEIQMQAKEASGDVTLNMRAYVEKRCSHIKLF